MLEKVQQNMAPMHTNFKISGIVAISILLFGNLLLQVLIFDLNNINIASVTNAIMKNAGVLTIGKNYRISENSILLSTISAANNIKTFEGGHLLSICMSCQD